MAPKKAPKTPPAKTDKTPSVAQLRKKLHELTGFMPKSDSPRYLSERLEQVLAKQAAGENVRRFNGGGTAKVIGVSISVAGESAVKHALRDGETFSSFARVAFGRELRTRGLPNSADIVEAG